ncbi:hypothetical protein QV09_07870 [Gallibacterium salpingitidis]|uniref:N-acetyltransferase domain-containing protein n=1 Tax=Gallibacterium salpingitidis TaxID=505341 RepID=A0AB36E1S8_9PAST|nr:GNAT family protein [Gallibacterium salpingitidis]OBX09514.1 hypothetical protein QV09_07870 [Gallibacterium salpingitidis]WKT00391.1 GNAT family N-acetyltransferase [Gallibacterium salpingitidis]
MTINQYGQEVGEPLPNWIPAARPQLITLEGKYVRLVPLRTAGVVEQFIATIKDNNLLTSPMWTYLPIGDFSDTNQLQTVLEQHAKSDAPLHYAIVDVHTGAVEGSIALMRIDPNNGVIEVGWLIFTPALQRTVKSTELHYLLMQYVFDKLGYRRYEWKCDALNAPSVNAALRLGFIYEGTFSNAVVYKGRNRDTAWFSITAQRWPNCRNAFTAWLSPQNFNPDGTQRHRLSELRTS